MNWDDARVFLALCREGTLRAAARALGVDQATVGRRLASLERALSARLFLRRSDGYVLTHAGEQARDAVQSMEEAAADLQRRILGTDERLSGEVRVTTTDAFAMDLVIPAIAELRRLHPGIEVKLQASTQMLNLSRREADIAVRTRKPDNPELIVRRIARWKVGLCASSDYLSRCGEPLPGSGFVGHDLVLYQPTFAQTRASEFAGEGAGQGRIAMTCTSGLLVRQAVAAGIGLGELPLPLAVRDGLLPLWPERPRAPYDVWLVTHQDLRHTARVRVVIDALARVFAAVEDVP